MSIPAIRAAQVLAAMVCAVSPVWTAGAGPSWIKTGGPPGGVGYDVKMRPDNPDIMYVTDTSSGVNISTDGGQTWSASNTGITSRVGQSGDAIPIFCLTMDPNHPDVMWAGTQGMASLYKSTDAGKTWVEKDKGIVEPVNTAFRGITVDARNSNTMYAAAEVPTARGVPDIGKQSQLVGGVVYRSTDGGESWSVIWRGGNLARYILIDPRNSNTLYVSTGIFDREASNSDPTAAYAPGGYGVLKTTDGGQTWQSLNEANGLMNRYVGSLFMHPANPDILLAAAGNNTYLQGAGVYLSTDGGQHWKQTLAETFSVTSVKLALSDPSIAYAAGPDTFYRSADGGQTWTVMAGGPQAQGIYGPPGTHVGFPIDLLPDPRNPNRVFINNYQGGNFLSVDGGRTWTSSSKGYTGSQPEALALMKGNARQLYSAGASGIFSSTDAGASWQGLQYPSLGLDGWMEVATDPSDSQHVLLGEPQCGKIFRSRTGGTTWAMVFQHPKTDCSFNRHGFNALVFASSNPSVVYGAMRRDDKGIQGGQGSGSYGVYKSVDGGETWTAANDANTAVFDVYTLVVDRQSENTAYIGTLSNGVWQTVDGGKSWRQRSQGLPQLAVRALAIDTANPLMLYAGLDNGGVYQSSDGGASWSRSGYGMDPQAMVHAIAVAPAGSSTVFAADLRTGVYRSIDGGKTWVQIDQGLSTRAVNALAISADGSTLYAASDGEGVFRLDLSTPMPSVLSLASAATFGETALAPQSIVSAFGTGLADGTAVAGPGALPTTLGTTTVMVTDGSSSRTQHQASLFYVSPGQINFLVPSGLPQGLAASVQVFRQGNLVAQGSADVEAIAPGLFTANADGKGVPAAVAVRVAANGQQSQLDVYQCGTAPGSCGPVPIDLGAATDQVFLELYGTGIRGCSALKDVSAKIGSQNGEVVYAGPQGYFAGLDQVNVRVPRSLAGQGDADVVLVVCGSTTNTVTVNIR
jgi:uncharacterized protein (TIGR03437 family)